MTWMIAWILTVMQGMEMGHREECLMDPDVEVEWVVCAVDGI